MGCGLLFSTSCASGRKSQLKAAVEEINKQCPAPIANGVIFQEITYSEDTVDMFYVLQENTITIPVTEESLPTWKNNFTEVFAGMVHADASMQALFELIGKTESKFTITIMLAPSQTKHVITFTHDDIMHILSVNDIKR